LQFPQKLYCVYLSLYGKANSAESAIFCCLIKASYIVMLFVCARNGHMMTHSAKKPYECKFFGCDKSYCDARSLRRHLENHHHQLLETCSSAAGSLTPRSAIADSSGSAGQGLIFSFDFAGGSPASGTGGLACLPLSGSDASLTTDPTSPLSSVSPGGPSNQLPPGIWTGDGNPFE